MRDGALFVLGLAIVALLVAIAYQNQRRFHTPLLTTPYQAVVLQNGSVFYGRVDHLGTDHPVVRDAFTVRAEIDPQTGRPRHVVVKRRDDIHGADHLIVPAGAIAFVEPVRPDSTIGRLIGEGGR
jgi:hypothetical protein